MDNPQARQQRFDPLLSDAANRLVRANTSTATAETEQILDHLMQALDADQAVLRSYDQAGERTRLVAETTNHPAAAGAGTAAELPHHDQMYVAVEGRTRATIVDSEDETTAIAPLLKDDEVIGTLAVVTESRPWTDDDVQAVESIASLLANLWGRLGAEDQLVEQIWHDELTGLPNRRKLTETLRGLTEEREASLLILDVDNMKVINDGLDFETGNQFIQGLAERLVAVVRPSGTVARLDGDQFAVLVLDTPPRHVERMAHRLVQDMAETIQIQEDMGISRSMSIGVAHNYIAETNLELLTEADAALFQAKRLGKSRMTVFDDEMRAKVIDSFEVEIELRQALDADELILHYQPEVDLLTGEVVAVEALLRWNHPHRGLLAAGVFIETAEESGLVVEIGDQVLRQAISQLAEWNGAYPHLEMWINVSPAQLMSRDVATQIQRLLTEFNVPADRICLEVTEHVVLGDLDTTTGILRRLRDMGIKLALDDFGTGYSSMKQLKQLPITSLKIDMTFVAGLGISEHDSAIVDAAINLAEAFGLGTVAEGIETHQQITELRKRGCRSGQGYLLGRPAAPEQIAELLGNPIAIDQLPQPA
ncbi:MAG: putative bifunctional diguanylate cyclase/phosphodiesterase [Acidimicrobiales bacterium]